MRRNIKWLLGIGIASLTLTGCGTAITLTDKEENIVAQFAARYLLDTNDEFASRLVVKDSSSPTAAPSSTPISSSAPTTSPSVTAAVASTGSAASAQTDSASSEPKESAEPEEKFEQVSLNELYHVDGFSLSYKSYEICKEYPRKTKSYQLSADKGEVLFVVKFKVKNTTNKAKTINLMKREISYELVTDSEETYKPDIAILANGGLNYLKAKVKPGKTENVILTFSLKTSERDSKSFELHIKENKNENVISVK